MMRSPLLFQTYREWSELPYVDPRLLGPFMALVNAFFAATGKPIMVTCVHRTAAENVDVGGKANSGHIESPVRAIDIRTYAIQDYPGLTPVDRKWILDFWYANFRFGQFWSAVDEGDHVHIQCPARPKPLTDG